MNTPILSPAVEFCLIHCGIVVQDFEQGWITAYESQSQGLGYVYFMKNQFDHPRADSNADIVLPATSLREQIATAIAQGSIIHLG